MRTCIGRSGRRRRVSRRSAQVRAAAGGALSGTALSEDRDHIEGHSQAPGPPLPPRDEPLAQTGPERFVRSARVRQGRPLSTRPGAQPDRHAGTCRRRCRRQTSRRGCAALPGEIRLPSGPARLALNCQARNSPAARSILVNADRQAGSTGGHRELWPGTGALPEVETLLLVQLCPSDLCGLGKSFPGLSLGFPILHYEEVSLASREGLTSPHNLVSGLLADPGKLEALRGWSTSGEVWRATTMTEI